MKLLRRMLLGLSLLLCAVALLLAWLVHTESGTGALVHFAAGALGDTLTVQDVHGTLAREVRFESLRYRDPAAAIDLRLDRGKLTVTTGALLRGRLRVASAALDGVVLDLPGTPPASAGPAPRSPMQLPVAIELDGLTLERVELRTGGTTALALDRIELAGSWTERGIEVRRLAVAAEQGNASVSGASRRCARLCRRGRRQLRVAARRSTLSGHTERRRRRAQRHRAN
jgi:translocation and assembly module TamB